MKQTHHSSAVQWYKRPSTEQLQEVSSKIQCKDESKPCFILKGNTDSINDKVTPFIDSVKPSGSVGINIYGGNNEFNIEDILNTNGIYIVYWYEW